MDRITDATIAEIEQEMAGDGVWVDPGFANSHGISAADEAAVEEAVASASEADVRVVLVEVDSDDERFQGSFANLSAWLQDDAGGDATYVGYDSWSEPHLSVQAYGDQPDTTYADNVAAHEHPDDLVAQLVRIPELLDDGNAQALWDEVPSDERYSWTPSSAEQRKPSAWKSPVRCWFNPLHDGPTTEVSWRDDAREVDVPACAACAADVRAGREPGDILDFIEGNRTVPYFRLDLGAWSTTGYGTLDRDLLGALRSSGRRRSLR